MNEHDNKTIILESLNEKQQEFYRHIIDVGMTKQ